MKGGVLQGESATSSEKICEIFAYSFTVPPIINNSEIETSNIIKEHILKPHDVITPSTTFSDVSPSEVVEAIKHLKNKGGPGHDFVPMKLFKLCSEQISVPLSYLFTTIFILCNVPQCFKVASVLPMYKGKGSYTDPNNYRPISILPPIMKIFERIIFQKLLPIVEFKFIDQQHGYRQSRSCQTALTLFTQEIFNLIDGRNQRAGAVFVDLRKAFNSVDHEILIRKLLQDFDRSLHINRLIISYLNDRIFRVTLGPFGSTYFPDKRGVPQGSPLGNLLFTIFVNDIIIAIYLPFLLYADDLVFYTHGTNPIDIVNKLSNTLINVDKWCSANKLRINEVKTEFMLFHKSHDTKVGSVPPLMLNGKEIKRVYQFRYLGVVLDPNLSFQIHLNSVNAKVSSAIFKLNCVKRYVPELEMKIIFNAYILSIYDYCIEIWCVQSKTELETLQSKIYRFLLSYIFPVISKKYKKLPSFLILHRNHGLNTHTLLQRFNLLSVHERMTWTIMKNAHSYLSSPVPGLN